MTSVKEFAVAKPPEDGALGVGAFYFTDAYSIFDWGQMPDPIPGKGPSLCSMGAFNFELLEDAGVPTHYRGVIADESLEHNTDPADTMSLDPRDATPIREVEQPPQWMVIDLAQVPDLPRSDGEYDYDAYHDAGGDTYVVPLEIVFRNAVPMGSSLRRRTEPADHGLSYDSWPEEPLHLDEPIVEFSTKYEASDRYLSHEEADTIAGTAAIEDLESLARTVNRVITDHATEQGFTHQDGKIEVFYHNGTLKVADVVGTFDENRFSYAGQQLSKEILRAYYRANQPEWVEAVSQAKSTAKGSDDPDWKGRCDKSPAQLPESVLQTISNMYRSGANAYIGWNLFDTPDLVEVVEELRSLDT